ncbi:monofunctional biosynthetic peptidoglycan transglycosylase [Breoghania corrubedonensis]|uniref:monofunctional biosynthetic peptidoglycan transglycosylase n=1 Tax=Breoghania corrubedonensis TaxID=665038 RepID=UPI000D3C8146|nr:monofunctional biosynthetic peptidoglycan transglycosylase [Breoghania corrubedonensis]
MTGVAKRASGRRTARRRLVWLLFKVAVFLALLPLLVTLVYAVLPAVSTPMLARLLTGHKVERIWTPLDAISPTLQRSVIASEDARFCVHDGVDWSALMEQVSRLEEGEDARGASTITMQLAKNLFLWPSRSYVRKTLEIPLAMWIDLVLSKRRILELYLNVAEWGDGIFGIEAAARHYYGISADKLSAAQAARLATVLPNPIARDPTDLSRRHAGHARAVRRRANIGRDLLDCL